MLNMYFQAGHDVKFEQSGDGSDVYNVIGSEGSPYTVCLQEPSCTCVDWNFFKLPCKHILAIVTRCPNATWEMLPAFYRNSVFFVLDVPENLLSQDLSGECSSEDEQQQQEEQACVSETIHEESQPQSSSSVTALNTFRSNICKILDRMRQYIYLQDSEALLLNLHTQLQSSLDLLQASCQRSFEGLPIYPENGLCRRKRQSSSLEQIPVTPKKKRVAKRASGIGK